MNKFAYIFFRDQAQKAGVVDRIYRNFENDLPFELDPLEINDLGHAILVNGIVRDRLIPEMKGFGKRGDRVLAVDGLPYASGASSNDWMETLLDLFETETHSTLHERLMGDYCYLEHTPRRTVASANISGFCPIYYYETDAIIGISNRQRLLHRLIHSDSQVRFDTKAFSWIVGQGNVFGDNSPIEGVRRIASGDYIEIVNNELHVGQFPRFYQDVSIDDRPPRQIIEAAADALVEQASALAAQPGLSLRLELTGGKDSRAVLAIARLSGLEKHVTHVETRGGPRDPDVLTARRLAEQTGLTNYRNLTRMQQSYTPSPGPFDHPAMATFWDGLRRRILTYDGVLSTQIGAPLSRLGQNSLTLTGTGGEMLGNIRTGPKAPLASRSEAYAWVERCQMMLDPLRVETDDIREWQRSQLRSMFDSYADQGVAFDDVPYLMWLDNRFPWWAGYGSANNVRRRIFPLINRAAGALMFALPARYKAMQALHFELARRAGPGFVETPLLKLPFDPRLSELYPDIHIPTEPLDIKAAAAMVTAKPLPSKNSIPPMPIRPEMRGKQVFQQFADTAWVWLHDYLLDSPNSQVFEIVSRRRLAHSRKSRDQLIGRLHGVHALLSLVMLRMQEEGDALPFSESGPH